MSELHLLRIAVWREVYSRRKAFAISTASLLVLVVGGLWAASLAVDDGPPTVTIGVVGEVWDDLAADVAGRLGGAIEVDATGVRTRSEGEDLLRSGELTALIVSDHQAVWGPSVSGPVVDVIASSMRAAHLHRLANELALTPEQAARLMAPIEGRTIDFEERDTGVEVVTVVSVVLMFVAIIAYGQWIAYGVVEEKANRVAELILGALGPRQLLAAKMIGLGGMGLLQLVVVGGAALLTASRLTGIALPPVAGTTLVWLVAWFLLGYAFYGSLYAAAGSLAADTQEAGSVIGPLNILPGVGYGLGVIAFSAGGGIVTKILSLVPLWSPLVMPGRIARGEAPWWEISVAVVVMVVSTAVMMNVASRVYLGGITQATRSVGWRQAFRGGGDLRGRSTS